MNLPTVIASKIMWRGPEAAWVNASTAMELVRHRAPIVLVKGNLEPISSTMSSNSTNKRAWTKKAPAQSTSWSISEKTKLCMEIRIRAFRPKILKQSKSMKNLTASEKSSSRSILKRGSVCRNLSSWMTSLKARSLTKTNSFRNRKKTLGKARWKSSSSS